MEKWSEERLKAYERYAKQDMQRCEEYMVKMVSLQRDIREVEKMARYYFDSAKELKKRIVKQKEISEEERLKELNDFLAEVQLHQIGGM